MKKTKDKKDNKVRYGTISLPLPLIEKIKKTIHGTGMNSVSSYVAFILREILSSPISEDESKESIKRRLKILGYI